MTPFRVRVHLKWERLRAQGLRVERGLLIAVAAGAVLVVAGVLWFGAATASSAGMSLCRANLKQLARGLASYAADHDEKLPPLYCDAEALLGPYVGGGPRRCRANSLPGLPSYTISPSIAGMGLGAIATPEETTVALIETGYRHTLRGQPAMALVYMSRRGGSAPPERVDWPPEGGGTLMGPPRGSPAWRAGR